MQGIRIFQLIEAKIYTSAYKGALAKCFEKILLLIIATTDPEMRVKFAPAPAPAVFCPHTRICEWFFERVFDVFLSDMKKSLPAPAAGAPASRGLI